MDYTVTVSWVEIPVTSTRHNLYNLKLDVFVLGLLQAFYSLLSQHSLSLSVDIV